jgi:thimet oligopeptidase
LHYLENIIGEEKYSLNEEEIAEYFELSAVRDGFFTITQKVFGLKFQQIDNPSVWHDEVTMYEVFDAESNNRLGYFYLDLFPRENKYGHAAHFGIAKGKQTRDGYQYPTASLVCNFTRPSGDKPSLMKHKSEVGTFFHEFGHLIHGMVTTAKYFAHSGTSVDRDFVEAPSQIFENWVWDKESLQLFAKHYKTGEAIPDDLLESMLAAKNMSSGGDMAFQVYLGSQDLTLYDTWGKEQNETLLEMSQRLHKDILMWNETPNTARIASFGHLNGYASSYYGYAWAEVFAQDMFSVFERDGVLNPEVGMRFRKEVLAPGGSVEALDLVRGFLGREPNNDALKRSLGL